MSVCNKTGQVTQFDEIYVQRTPIERIDSMIRQKLGSHGLEAGDVKYIYTDPAGNAEELSSGISPVDHLRSVGHTVINKGGNVAPGLALVRSYVLNAAGKRRYLIHERCINTVRSFYGYSYKLGIFKSPTEEPDKDNVHDHMCDAIRYFFVNKFDKAKWVASTVEQNSYLSGTNRPMIMKRCMTCRRPFSTRSKKNEPPHVCGGCKENIDNGS